MIKKLKELLATMFVVAHAQGGLKGKLSKQDADEIKSGLQRGKATRQLPGLNRGSATRSLGGGMVRGAVSRVLGR